MQTEDLDDFALLRKKAEILLDQPIKIEIEVDPVNWRERLLMALRIRKSKYQYEVKGAKLGTMIKISKLLLDLEYHEEPEDGQKLAWAFRTIGDGGLICAEIIAEAIHNNRTPAPEKLKKLILDNFEAKDFKKTVMSIIAKMDVFAFTDTITSIRKLDILREVSPEEPAEKIALEEKTISGVGLETLSSIFGSVSPMP